jgi:hypothetical protein
MKLTTLLKEVKAKKKVNEAMSFEFEIDAQGNLEIYDTYGERLLAVVDKSTGTIDYKTGSMVRKDQIRAAAERFLDDESDQRDSSSMYADRFSEAPERSDSSAPRMSDDYPFVSKEGQYRIFASTFLNALASAIEDVDSVDEAESNINAFIEQSHTDLVEMAMELISSDHPMFN